MTDDSVLELEAALLRAITVGECANAIVHTIRRVMAEKPPCPHPEMLAESKLAIASTPPITGTGMAAELVSEAEVIEANGQALRHSVTMRKAAIHILNLEEMCAHYRAKSRSAQEVMCEHPPHAKCMHCDSCEPKGDCPHCNRPYAEHDIAAPCPPPAAQPDAKAPERIWLAISAAGRIRSQALESREEAVGGFVGYAIVAFVRADLLEAAEARIAELENEWADHSSAAVEAERAACERSCIGQDSVSQCIDAIAARKKG